MSKKKKKKKDQTKDYRRTTLIIMFACLVALVLVLIFTPKRLTHLIPATDITDIWYSTADVTDQIIGSDRDEFTSMLKDGTYSITGNKADDGDVRYTVTYADGRKIIFDANSIDFYDNEGSLTKSKTYHIVFNYSYK